MYFGEAVGAARRADAGAALGAARRSRRWRWWSASSTSSGSRRSPPRPPRRSCSSGWRAGRPGVGREIHDALDSTNAEALRRAAAGEAGPLWILARRQTAARGRRGRAWAAPAGNFGATLLMRPPGDAGAALVRGGARALRRDGGGDRAAGALRAEVAERRAARRAASSPASCSRPVRGGALAVGIGVNLADGAGARRRWSRARCRRSSLRGGDRARGRRRRTSSTCWRRRSQAWEDAAGRRGLRAAPRRLAGARRRGSARRSPRGCRAGTLAGRFETVDETGALVLATADGPRGAAGGRDPLRGGGAACCSPLTSATPTWSSRCTTASAVVAEWRCRTERQRTADEYFVWLRQLMDLERHRAATIALGGRSPRWCRRCVFNLRVLADRYFHTRAAGRRQARGASIGPPPRVDPDDQGRRRPAGQHRRRLRPLRRRPDRRRLRHRHHLRRGRRGRRLRGRGDRARASTCR